MGIYRGLWERAREGDWVSWAAGIWVRWLYWFNWKSGGSDRLRAVYVHVGR